MMVGVDVTHVARVRELLDRYPKAAERYFSDAERQHCLGHPDPAIHFAGTFAAKEAVVKALRLGSIGVLVKEIEIRRDEDGAPSVRVKGEPHDVTLSISHDAGIAIAVAVAGPSDPTRISRSSVDGPAPGEATARTGHDSEARPNANLARYLSSSPPLARTRRASRLRESSESYAGSDFP